MRLPPDLNTFCTSCITTALGAEIANQALQTTTHQQGAVRSPCHNVH